MTTQRSVEEVAVEILGRLAVDHTEDSAYLQIVHDGIFGAEPRIVCERITAGELRALCMAAMTRLPLKKGSP